MTGRYRAYPEYKDSGVDWLSKVPKHWRLKPLRAVLEFRNEKNSPEKTSNILSLSIAKGVTEYSESEGKSGNKRKDDLTAYKLAYPNDIVINSMNIIVGAVGVSKYFGAISPVYYALYAKDKAALIRYYGAIFHNTGFQRGLLKFGKGILIKQSDSGKLNTIRMKVSQDDLKAMYFPQPPIEEQQKIANFLDHETTKIDTLIAKQEKLIELLKEKRQTVISHAVTKGLNPDVPMKDSGVEWLGKVPENWKVIPIKRLAELTPKKSQIENKKDSLCNFIPMDKLKQDLLILDEERKISSVFDGYTYFEDEDILLAKVTPCFENKNMIVARNLKNGIGFGSSEIYVLRCNNQAVNDFMYYRLQDDVFMSIATSAMTGAGGLKRVPADIITNFQIALPSNKEQVIIVKALKSQLKIFDNLIIKANSAIDLMKERKIALISAAVTGKIDVRNYTIPEKVL